MKLRRVLIILIVLVLISSAFFSSSLARFTDEFAGSDTALIAKWNFGARGEDDTAGEFYNKGFTFDLFNAESVEPMDFGVKSFTFTGGGSDVAILYDVQMNADDLLWLTEGTVAKTVRTAVYAPFVFKIIAEINDGAVDTAPPVFSPPDYDSGWFRPVDITTDEDGYFSIFDHTNGEPFFSPGSMDSVTVTVYWQWNTSCYINDTGTAFVSPDTSTEISETYLPYYQAAYDEYYGPGGLEDRREAAADAVSDYLDEHGSPASDGTWEHDVDCELSDEEHNSEYESLDPEAKEDYLLEHGGTDDGTGGITWSAHSVLCSADHFREYNDLVDEEHDAIDACETSLMAAYDDYDTLAADALAAKESVKVIFRIKGDQIAPEQNM
ncbi:hypothetical protein [Candidatus Formimonas warabiya]|uniref:Uncharacterized protein n=1 Tax=Formimonas warabiya TaxID=1761012 RepID=A0A3G1KLZ8_FORW1|nr:hypothetical protein [Candidatus Formimonas warabiya]ATW23434.1 hypothetical protein DCMF_00260 [Candidatus Formimonas warabiya]